MSEPKRIQRKRTRGWKMPENAVYVGRPTKWGNPYSIHDEAYQYFLRITPKGDRSVKKAQLIRQVVANYKADILSSDMLDDIGELRGKDLACWCPLDATCHADVLLELAKGKEEAPASGA